MANGLFIPSFRGAGSPGAPGVGSTQRGLQLVEQGRNTLAQQRLGLERAQAAQPGLIAQDVRALELAEAQQPGLVEAAGIGALSARDQARAESLIQGAIQLKSVPQAQKLQALIQRRAEVEAAGLPGNDTDEAIALAQAGRFDELEQLTDRAIAAGRQKVSAKEQATTEKLKAETGKIKAETAQIPIKAKSDALKKSVAESKTKFDQSGKIRAEILKESAEFNKIVASFDRIRATDATAGGDLALIFNFMKMLDPGSVVRETEFATAQNAAGVPDRVRNTFNRLLSGERLNPNQRKDFIQQADNIFSVSKKRNDQTVESFVNIAERNGIDREDVVIARGEELPVEEETAPTGDQELPEGTVIKNPTTGQRLQVVNGQLVEVQ